jgi:hypothetical protein
MARATRIVLVACRLILFNGMPSREPLRCERIVDHPVLARFYLSLRVNRSKFCFRDPGIGVGIFPKRQEVVLGDARFSGVALQGVGPPEKPSPAATLVINQKVSEERSQFYRRHVSCSVLLSDMSATANTASPFLSCHIPIKSLRALWRDGKPLTILFSMASALSSW